MAQCLVKDRGFPSAGETSSRSEPLSSEARQYRREPRMGQDATYRGWHAILSPPPVDARGEQADRIINKKGKLVPVLK
jgi:hypothetical protein